MRVSLDSFKGFREDQRGELERAALALNSAIAKHPIANAFGHKLEYDLPVGIAKDEAMLQAFLEAVSRCDPYVQVYAPEVNPTRLTLRRLGDPGVCGDGRGHSQKIFRSEYPHKLVEKSL